MQEAALYIHIPWCIRKCPYCDFNSHKSPEIIAEKTYVDHLIQDFKWDVEHFGKRHISSIFIGGGTPSLLSANAYQYLFEELNKIVAIDNAIEITMEANPGTAEQTRFLAYRKAGINRLSLGIQSFNPLHLRKLGRIHDDDQAHRAIQIAREAGFNNINLDIMHGLPEQSMSEGLTDLEQALSYQPEHLSWYQLTLEPNTVFYKNPPALPDEDTSYELEQNGLAMLHKKGFRRYEISAFCHDKHEAQHNLNYWLFGDYFGIGAGAHGKLSSNNNKTITRLQKKRQPNDYQKDFGQYTCKQTLLTAEDICFEYMLNTTRLNCTHSFRHFEQQTGLTIDKLLPHLHTAQAKGFITTTLTHWQITPLGRQFTNELQAIFLHS